MSIIYLTIGYNFFMEKKYISLEKIKLRLSQEIRLSGFTTVEIAKKIGVSPEMITQYCTTKKMPSIETLAKLCSVLDISADYILGLKDY